MMNNQLVDLEINKYKIYQDKNLFCFGMDAVLLANFALEMLKIRANDNRSFLCADICSGNAPIPFIMYAKFINAKILDCRFDCFEINEKAVKLINDSIYYNSDVKEDDGPKDININKYFKIYNMDLKKIIFDKAKYSSFRDSYDLVTCNPPYMKKGACLSPDSIDMAIARSEEKINFDEICDVANFMLKSKKNFYIIHKSERLSEIILTLKKYNLEPKNIKFIHSSLSKNSNLFLLEAVKDAKSGMNVLPPIIINKTPPTYIV